MAAASRRKSETGQGPIVPPYQAPSSKTRDDLKAVVPREDYERLRGVCARALELLRSRCKGDEHVEVQANALAQELEKMP